MSYTFKPKARKGKAQNPKRKSLTLTDDQLEKFNKLKANFDKIAYQQDAGPPTDAYLWSELIDYGIDDLISATDAQLATNTPNIVPLPSVKREQDAKKIVGKGSTSSKKRTGKV